MNTLRLPKFSRSMSDEVNFVLAIPILEPAEASRFVAPNPVAGVVYIDSTADSFFVDNDQLQSLAEMIKEFLQSLIEFRDSGRMRNFVMSRFGEVVPPPKSLPNSLKDVVELVEGINPPSVPEPFQFNFDYCDFVPI